MRFVAGCSGFVFVHVLCVGIWSSGTREHCKLPVVELNSCFSGAMYLLAGLTGLVCGLKTVSSTSQPF